MDAVPALADKSAAAVCAKRVCDVRPHIIWHLTSMLIRLILGHAEDPRTHCSSGPPDYKQNVALRHCIGPPSSHIVRRSSSARAPHVPRAGELAALVRQPGGGAAPGLLLASLALAPALEELLFRGFLLPCLAARMPLPAAVRACATKRGAPNDPHWFRKRGTCACGGLSHGSRGDIWVPSDTPGACSEQTMRTWTASEGAACSCVQAGPLPAPEHA